MLKTSQNLTIAAGDMTGTLHGKAIDLASIVNGSIQSVYTGAPAGNLFLEISNDIVAPGADPDASIANWTTYGGSSVAIAAAGNYMHNISNMGYKWCRISYVPTGGNGTLNSTAVTKYEI